jgi:hypothetical protein
MSWDRPWEPSLEMKERARESERQRQEQLDAALIDSAQELAEMKGKVEAEAEKTALMTRLLGRKQDLLAELGALQRERLEAQKTTRTAERRLELDRRRAERLGSRTYGPRNGRPVRIDVDDGAWAVVQRDVIANRTSMIGHIGHLVTVEVEQLAAHQVTGSPSGRHRRSPGEGDPAPHRRFLRVHVDDDTWTALRVAATDIGITVTRYLGELVEAEAHRLGWRAEGPGPAP